MDLAKRTCEVCRGEIPPMEEDEIREFLRELNGD